MKNNCNFTINVWYCLRGHQYGCGTSKGLIDPYINASQNQRNQIYGYKTFSKLRDLRAGEQERTGSSSKYTILYFACKGRSSKIVNNKKGAAGFSCRTQRGLIR